VRLILIRHADSDPGTPDELRRLNATGREQARALGERLAESGVEPDAVLTSPLLRARETGEAVAAALGCTSEAADALAPGATTDGVREAIAGRGETVVVIGHQPDCGRIAAELGNGEEPRFPPAGMIELDLDGP
jgi:phosphohistidine phosphatase